MKHFCLVIVIFITGQIHAQKFTLKKLENYTIVENAGGAKLGYANDSKVKILTVDGLAFKDLNRNNVLDVYEDWRIDFSKRAMNLASQMSIEQIAGLMLYSSHQSIPARASGYFAGTYNGKPYVEGQTNPSDLTDQQKKFLEEDNLRHVLLTTVVNTETAAQWNNKIQAYCESLGLGIPANNSSDPRHGTNASAEYNAASGGNISMWPSSLGLAATFDADIVEKFGKIAAAEYRALGLTTALSPQVDIATDPRWARFNGTFGESPKLAADMGRAYCDGFQSSTWGIASVNAMVKHWPGGGSGEAGRDAHYANGKFAVYPGNNFNQHLIPFIKGAFKLRGKTGKASAVMPYYTISFEQDKSGEKVANNYSKFMITDLLRNKYKYDGVVCTDWLVTADHKFMDVFIDGKSFGVENLSLAERHLKILMAGVDQFGGNNDKLPILEAFKMGSKQLGEKAMRARMEQSAVRLLLNIFRVGLFENPYLDFKMSKSTVGKSEYMKDGFEAQLKSIVMLKNVGKTLPLASNTKVYVPKRYVPASRNFLGMETPASENYPVNIDVLKKYFIVVDNADESDVALVFIENPKPSAGYDKTDVEKGGNGYIPISLQYAEYNAVHARAVSIAGGDILEKFSNRSYKNKTTKAANFMDADLVKVTKEIMGTKPVIVAVNSSNPMVCSEIEPFVNAMLMSFDVQHQALFEILSGKSEPSALLPMQLPETMETVEKQAEDVPFDVQCHRDMQGNIYDFGFGLNWQGVIKDKRTKKYKK